MTANELADELWEKYLDNNECQHGYALSSGCSNDDCKEQALYDAANMLRQFGLAESIIKQQQLEIEALKNNLDFIVGINRLGLGVQKEGGLSSEEIEKIWLSIKEQRDDNFHYGWKKCEQYYAIRKAEER